ncbi:hypothetical protein [Falsihalocynthiibacter sp. CO-5D18]|uniref:hypothetical protein n=1 Tax=Falsihalocynthiibacter sp. CO-5D18 TaxID=3240872 RepID=UPI00351027C7
MNSVKDRPHDFFSDTWTATDGWKSSPKYRKNVLSLDPKGKNDPLRASIAWLRQIGAIDEYDEITIRELTEERNRLAHELRKVLGGTHRHDFENLFPKLISLVAKIERWWIVNVEIATDPDLAGKEFDEDGVTPGSVILLQVLNQVALGKDEEAWALYHEFISANEYKNT